VRNGISEPSLSTPTRRRAWLCFVLGVTLLSVVLADAQEQRPANANDAAKAQEESERDSAEKIKPPSSINTKPLADVALRGKQLVEEGRFGHNTTLDVTATAECNEDGTLKPETVELVWATASDEYTVEFVRQFFSAVSESRVLGSLEGAKSVRLGFKLDRQNFSLLVASELPSAEEAMKYVRGYSALIQIARLGKKGTPEGNLYEHLGFASEGKVFKISFEMPRDEAVSMIADILAKRAARNREATRGDSPKPKNEP